jgi:hypothetical protein
MPPLMPLGVETVTETGPALALGGVAVMLVSL